MSYLIRVEEFFPPGLKYVLFPLQHTHSCGTKASILYLRKHEGEDVRRANNHRRNHRTVGFYILYIHLYTFVCIYWDLPQARHWSKT